MLSFNFGSSCKFFILASSPSFLYLPTSVGHTPLPSRPSTPSVVHPHARGAYQLKWRFWTPYNGSSPPTWGIRCSTAPTIDISRFIPTYVGHTGVEVGLPWLGPVHPHIRGAYVAWKRNQEISYGSSPHTWGILNFNANHQRPPTVHPHIRGAYYPL